MGVGPIVDLFDFEGRFGDLDRDPIAVIDVMDGEKFAEPRAVGLPIGRAVDVGAQPGRRAERLGDLRRNAGRRFGGCIGRDLGGSLGFRELEIVGGRVSRFGVTVPWRRMTYVRAGRCDRHKREQGPADHGKTRKARKEHHGGIMPGLGRRWWAPMRAPGIRRSSVR